MKIGAKAPVVWITIGCFNASYAIFLKKIEIYGAQNIKPNAALI